MTGGLASPPETCYNSPAIGIALLSAIFPQETRYTSPTPTIGIASSSTICLPDYVNLANLQISTAQFTGKIWYDSLVREKYMGGALWSTHRLRLCFEGQPESEPKSVVGEVGRELRPLFASWWIGESSEVGTLGRMMALWTSLIGWKSGDHLQGRIWLEVKMSLGQGKVS